MATSTNVIPDFQRARRWSKRAMYWVPTRGASLAGHALAGLRQKALCALFGGRRRVRVLHPEAISAATSRHAARAARSRRRAVRVVRCATGLERDEQAQVALEVVARGIVFSLDAAQSRRFTAQLPYELKQRLRALPPGPNARVTMHSIVCELAKQLTIDAARASELAMDVGLAVAQLVSPGAAKKVRSQLPKRLRTLLPVTADHSPLLLEFLKALASA